MTNDPDVLAALKDIASQGITTPAPADGFPPAEESIRHMVLETMAQRAQGVARPFSTLATHFMALLPDGPARDECVYHLLKARDAAIRA